MSYQLTSLPDRDFPVSDESQWEAFRQGDRDSYQKLYRKYLNDLYNYGCKIVPDQAIVADHIQDLFIDLWKYKDNLSGIKHVKHYLFRSLKNRIVKEVSQNRYTAYDMESEYNNALLVLPFEYQMIESQTQSETKERLRRALLALSKRQSEVINLLFYEKFSYEEVAGIMNINVRSVYTLAWKSLEVLRKELSCLLIAFLGYLFL